MKKRTILVSVILMIFLSIFISCKTTPPAQDPVATARDSAQESRQRAVDFQSPEYFPSEWEEVEAQFEAADNVEAYTAATQSYDELFEKTIPLYAQAREDEICALRDQVIQSGFRDYFPEFVENADNIALAAMAQYEAGDYYKARDTANEAKAEFEILHLGSRILIARQEIIDRGFTQFDAENFLRADEVSQTAIDAYEAGNKEDAVTNGEEALLRYNLVLSNGWTAYAAVRREAAIAEREHAMAERANIASRETFRRAESILNQAQENFEAENYSAAGLGFVDAEAMYAISREETETRRLRAQEAIRQAEEKIEESSEAAQEAQRLIEGGTR